MKYCKFTYIFLIIISNTSFGKEFDKLFTVYEPIIDSSNIEKSINTAFNKMIFRLSGDPSPSNIWKIINAGNNRKDFITSYSIENQNGITQLKVIFEKELLVNTFDELSIQMIGNSRPVFLFLINLDSGIDKPYLLSENASRSDLDKRIKKYLKDKSMSRGIFFELPDLDLISINELDKYKRLIGEKKYISDQYDNDETIEISISNIGFDSWIVSGDIEFKTTYSNLIKMIIKELDIFLNKKIDLYFDSKKINTNKIKKVQILINNINNFKDYKKSKQEIESFVSFKNMSIKKFHIDNILYEVEIYGDEKTFFSELQDNNFLEVMGNLNLNKPIQVNYRR